MRTSRVSLAVAAWLTGTLLLAGCRQAPPPRTPTTHTVVIDGMQNQPESLTVVVGDSVVWENHDPFTHTVTSTVAGAFDSKSIAPGESWRFVARTKGTFPYTCTFHPIMKGTLRVE
jgi:plastocyanin